MSNANSPHRLRSGGIPLISYLALCFFVLLCVAYHISISLVFDGINYLENFVNLHDHNVYLLNMDLVKGGDSVLELANDKGIASIYLLLSHIFPFLVTPDMAIMALIFNCAILIVSYKIYSSITDIMGLGIVGYLSFFANLSLLYFSQLINKDMLTICVFLLSAYAGMLRRHWCLLFIIPIVAFIRIQLALYIITYIFLASAKNIGPRFFIIYTFTSLLAAYLSVYFSVIGEDSLGDGFSAYLINLNNEHLMGYFLFNPIRLLQFIFDAYLSFDIFTKSGAIDVAKVLRLPQLILLALLAPYFCKLFTRWRIYKKSSCRPLVVVILAYACTWLMNPTINARYVMLVTPILVLLGLYLRRIPRHV